MNLRLFIAIDISQRIRGEIGNLIEILGKYDADIKWIKPENIHLTLKFLGGTSDALVPRIREAVAMLSSHKQFYITIHGVGVFPDEKHPRVLWIGIVNSDPLKALKDSLDNALSSIDFQRDDTVFHPHLTIGRVRSRKGILSLMREFSLFRDKQFGDCLVDRVNLMKSDLKPTGSEYTCLHSIELGG